MQKKGLSEMQKKVLSEIDLYQGYVSMPEGFEINRKEIQMSIFSSFVMNDTISNNPLDYSSLDYKVPFSRALGMLNTYLMEFFNIKYKKNLINKECFGNLYILGEQSILRRLVEPLDLRNSADYTCIYGVEVENNSCNLIIEYDDNRRKNRTWAIPIRNNYFIMFPSIQRYFITKNRTGKINTILTTTYDFI